GTAGEASMPGGGIKSFFGNAFNQASKEMSDSEEAFDFKGAMNKMFDQTADEVLVNPYQPGTEEYESFERNKPKVQKKENMQALTGGVQDALTGGLLESGVNLAATSIASHKAQKDAIKEYSRGKFAFNPSFNYL
ncbi:MAG: hypothetical protein ACTSQA_07870, partial [Candidatus Heimdallarchaeaceae archaeon]